MDELVPFGTADPYRLEASAEGARLFCISNALWPSMSGCLSDNLEQFTPDAESLLAMEVLSLNSSICITAITSRLDAILQAIMSLDVCCVLSQGNPGLEEPPADIEVGVGDPPVGETWDEYEDYLCCALQKQVDLCESTLDTLTDGLGALGLIGLDALALYLAPVAPPVALLLALLGVLTAILEDELFDQWEGELGLYASDAVCAAFLSHSPATAKMAVDAVIDAYVAPPPNRLLHKLLWSQTQLNRIFRGEIEGTEAYSSEYCDQCEIPPATEWHFDGTLEGWFLAIKAHDSTLQYLADTTHTPDGTGCALLYLDYHWYGLYWSAIQVNTLIEVVANQHIEVWHCEIGDANLSSVKIFFDDDREYTAEFGSPPTFPDWGNTVVDVPAAYVGAKIVALQLGYHGNDDYIYIDDVRIYHDA